MLQVCPLHGDADDVTARVLDGGVRQYTCSRSTGHPQGGPYVWESIATGDELDAGGADGVMDEYGLFSSLPKVVDHHRWVEYGVLEYRFATAEPDTFRELVDRYGHTSLGKKGYTASALLGACFGLLATRGDLLYRADKGTGCWAYNQPSSYYVKSRGAASEPVAASELLRYADFARALGEDPTSVAWWPEVW